MKDPEKRPAPTPVGSSNERPPSDFKSALDDFLTALARLIAIRQVRDSRGQRDEQIDRGSREAAQEADRKNT